MAKVSKVSVHYRNGTAAECCGNCSMYTPSPGSETQGTCSEVRGDILAKKKCDDWEPESNDKTSH